MLSHGPAEEGSASMEEGEMSCVPDFLTFFMQSKE